jgi:ATP-dependent Clp protease ATP-binding subunit ClpA
VEIPFTDDCRRALERAARDADDLENAYIGPEHLLLGLLHLEKSVAGSALIAHALRPNDVREKLQEMLRKASDNGAGVDIAGVINQVERLGQMIAQLSQVAGDKQATTALADALWMELITLKNQLDQRE